MGILDRAETLVGVLDSEAGQMFSSMARSLLEGASETKDAAESAADGVGSAAQSVGEGAKAAAETLNGAGKPALIVGVGLVGLTAASAAVSALRRRAETDGGQDEESQGQTQDE